MPNIPSVSVSEWSVETSLSCSSLSYGSGHIRHISVFLFISLFVTGFLSLFILIYLPHLIISPPLSFFISLSLFPFLYSCLCSTSILIVSLSLFPFLYSCLCSTSILIVSLSLFPFLYSCLCSTSILIVSLSLWGE
jgi:hypothetical protein